MIQTGGFVSNPYGECGRSGWNDTFDNAPTVTIPKDAKEFPFKVTVTKLDKQVAITFYIKARAHPRSMGNFPEFGFTNTFMTKKLLKGTNSGVLSIDLVKTWKESPKDESNKNRANVWIQIIAGDDEKAVDKHCYQLSIIKK
jgi:hypothetical protein